ncbi:MAG TPA: heat-inducible transcriptional repressor HrcA [Candidatus Limiplasma sp.]|nr:heat-inducible transcriptional repressor HrcA [Candidatus Limiplasma sp.]
MAMDARKFRILQAIIDDYILTAIPVGSRTISKRYDMGLSSATIRNEMSDLEELGYLDQPHVSAGRVPSAKAYRLYVDELLREGKLKTDDAQSIRQHFVNRTGKMEDVINRAAQVLSNLTSYTSLAMGPKGAEMTIRNLQLVPISHRSALLVIVTDGGIIRDSVIHVDSDLDSDALYAISRMLTERVAGHTLHETRQILKSLGQEFSEKNGVIESINRLVAEADDGGGKAKIAFAGPSNILNFPEYSDVEKARTFLSLLETKDTILSLLEQRQSVAFTVRIGPETGIPALEDCSLVTATYSLDNGTHGTIGVIGPTRMQYSRVLGVLSAMGQQLSSLLKEDKE